MLNSSTPKHLDIYVMSDTDRRWVEQAACTGSGANFFPSKMGEKGVNEAIAICRGCPVRVECLKYALNNNITHGIWGALTTRGRREMANALRYVQDPTRTEHTTARWYTLYGTLRDEDPLRRTAQTLGISKATVYHHLRIDRLAKEKTDEILNDNNTNRRDDLSSEISDEGGTDTNRRT
jgi:hypothetical protein